MSGNQRVVFFVPSEEKAWIQELVDASMKYGIRTSIGLYRSLLDAYARQIGFRPRPGSEEEK